MHWKSALGTALIVLVVLALLYRIPAIKTIVIPAGA